MDSSQVLIVGAIVVLVLFVVWTIHTRHKTNQNDPWREERNFAANQAVCHLAIDPACDSDGELQEKARQACLNADFAPSIRMLDLGPVTSLLKGVFPSIPESDKLYQTVIILLRRNEMGRSSLQLIVKPSGTWDPVFLPAEEGEPAPELILKMIRSYRQRMTGPFEEETQRCGQLNLLDFPQQN